MNKIDELFERKLADHVLDPLPGTWEKVEAGLSKKNNIAWVRWAAAIFLAGLLVSLLLIRKTENSPAYVETKEKPIIQPVEEKPAPLAVQEEKPAAKKRKKTLKPEPVVKTELPKEQIAEIKTEETIPVVVLTEQKTMDTDKTKTKPIVLTYVLDPVVTDSEIQGNGLAEKKDNSLKKVMKIANNVKNSESPLGSVRDMTHDLFARDLKKSTSKQH